MIRNKDKKESLRNGKKEKLKDKKIPIIILNDSLEVDETEIVPVEVVSEIEYIDSDHDRQKDKRKRITRNGTRTQRSNEMRESKETKRRRPIGQVIELDRSLELSGSEIEIEEIRNSKGKQKESIKTITKV